MLEFFGGYGTPFIYLGIVIFLVLTGAGLPIPEEVPIVAAGVLSASGVLSWPLAFASSLVGALLGDMLVYAIGRYLGANFLRRHPRFAHLLHEEREKQMEGLIQRHGLGIFFVARFMVGIRAPLYLAAGMLRVPFKRFIIVDAICATIVVSVVFWLSYRYGATIGKLIRQYQVAATVIVLAIVAVAAIWYFVRRHRRPPAASEGDGGADESASESESTASSRSVA